MKVKLINHGGLFWPQRAHHNDSGADVFAKTDVVIPAGKVISIPTGIGVEIPDGYDLVVHCKSGLSTKGIWASNAPVDAGYTGEIHAILYNTTNQDYSLNAGDKIGQLVMRPVIYPEFVSDFNEVSRGNDGFGSTGR